MAQGWASQVGLVVKTPPANAGDAGLISGWEDPLEEGMATHSSSLPWRIPWTEEPKEGCKELDRTGDLACMHTPGYTH